MALAPPSVAALSTMHVNSSSQLTVSATPSGRTRPESQAPPQKQQELAVAPPAWELGRVSHRELHEDAVCSVSVPN